ncbi:sulfite exporter TauE/SafE family protein [Candidatus Woesearchaeota archaeon]|nr:sulfite exporter TauE/SafE family protein [Candidatus Woesearchaeota archaeon]
MDNFIYFSFIQGMLAFFAPCAVALLPAYIVSFISRNKEQSSSKKYLLLRGFKLASLSILGILIIYALAGTMILFAGQLIKEYMKWIALSMGGALVILGIMMLCGNSISLNLHMKYKKHNSETAEAFFFGIAYAIGALGCLFPLFLVVTTQAIAAPNILRGGSYIIAYFLGISTLMIIAILMSIFTKDYLMKQLGKILPYMDWISGVLLILAGIYVIQYQLVLF